MKKLILILLIAQVLLFSCSSSKEEKEGYPTVESDAKPEVSMSIVDFDKAIKDEEYAKSMDGKIVEVNGKVIKTYSISENGDNSKGSHYIDIEGETEDSNPTITCFFAESQEGLMGKNVSVKGHFFNDKGYTGLMHCVAEEK